MKKLKIAIAQMNPVAGDIAANAAKILAWTQEAQAAKADLIVFPEMALCGYPVWDLANHPDFVRASTQAVQKLAAETKNFSISIIFGGIAPAGDSGPQAKVHNTLFWIESGKVQSYFKRLLPTYDVFLENIFFKEGKRPGIMRSRLGRIGVMVCEDLWDDAYALKPLAEIKKQKPDFVINISSSPYYQGVRLKREALLADRSKKYKLPIVYVNQTGAQDDLVFDGASMVYDKTGKKVFQAPAFEEGLFYLEDTKPKRSVLPAARAANTGEMYQALVLGVRDYFRKNGFKQAVIGLSGGIDSALVAAIAVDALGSQAVRGITMPSQYSSEGSWKDSMELAKNFGIECRVYPIHEKFDFMLKAYREQKRRYNDMVPAEAAGLAVENLQARLRGLELMFISNDENRLVLTTGNKSELAMGYCTLYGDMCGGLAVLGDVYKTQVYKLCEYRNRIKKVIPESILTKVPSAELRPNQKDQDSLPEYAVLDEILSCYIEKNMPAEAILKQLAKKKVPAETVWDTLRRTDLAEYKRRQTPPILRVTEKAWFGRRMPVTNGFRYRKKESE